MKTLIDCAKEPFFVFSFPDYRDDACYIMLAGSVLESLDRVKSTVKPPVQEVTVPMPYLELLGLNGVENDANVKLAKGIGVVTAYRLWDYGLDKDEELGFDTGACESFETVRLQLRASRSGYEFRAVGTSDYESLKGGAYEYTPWIPLENLADAAEKVACIAETKEILKSE